jgi:hypothetical protein
MNSTPEPDTKFTGKCRVRTPLERALISVGIGKPYASIIWGCLIGLLQAIDQRGSREEAHSLAQLAGGHLRRV